MKKFYKHPKFTAVFSDEDGYFSFTGDVEGGSGAVGDKIAEIDPRFAPLEAMHLSDAETGEPMHAWANADYFARKGKLDVLKAHLRVDDDGLKTFMTYHAYMSSHNGRHLKNFSKFKKALERKWQEDADKISFVVESIESNLCGSFVDPMIGDNLYISEEYKDELDDLDEEDRNKRIALAKFLDIDVLNVDGEGNDYEATGSHYLVLTDEEADEKAQEYVESSAWAFNAGFLASFTGMPTEMFEAIQDKCEDANDSVLHCIKMAGGIEKFAERAVHTDGRGHFLSSYDGREEEEEVGGVTYFIYRQ